MVIARHRADLFGNVYKEFSNNCLWINLGRDYRESKYFKEAVLYLIFNLCELNSTNNLGNIIHKFLKTFFLKNQDTVAIFIGKSGTKFYLFFGKTIKLSNVKNNVS